MAGPPSEFVIDFGNSTPSPQRQRGRYRRRHSSSPASVNLTREGLCQFEPDPNAWFNLMNIEIPHIQRICRWCMDGVQQTVARARNLMFPADKYKRELSVALDRLAQVEEELNKAVIVQQTKTPEQIKQNSMCCPSCNQKESKQDSNRTLPAETPKRRPKMVDTSVQTTPTMLPVEAPQKVSAKKPPLPPPPPPPAAPPPPPPPPVVPPPAKLKLSKAASKKPPKGKTQDSAPRVTLHDLQNVKLRSSSRRTRSKSPTSRRQSIAVFSQASITKDLKRAAEKSKTPTSRNCQALALAMDRLPQDILSAHKKLRKVELRRSPGGTPVVDKQTRRESGQGLTPMMTRALRRKFLLARSPCSPKEDPFSPSPAKKSTREITV